MKSFWIAYAFWFVTSFILSAITSDAIISMAWGFIASLAVFLFFDVWYFEEDEAEEAVDDDEEYITLFTIKY
ncbi:hypothetical protein MUA90_05600 [Staphylococcus sp. IVB6181]|uniref:hypothetical protein n=1 Tax=Staphylococcus sp. IVB6181 TaxID=2929481 RepID=UPI0021D3972F|nr:hypothetical protein [Staphylococcus sp. IVB6181]UXV35943.1 hypothetical protein MUA90_05600 [Staphylococcus sp. IVB6181]